MRASRLAVALAGLVAASMLLPGFVAAGSADAKTDGGLSIDRDGDAVTVANDSSQVIAGSADLPAGESVAIRIRSTGDTQPRFFLSKTATVDRNGTWAAAFDFAEQSGGGTFTVTVSAGDATANATGEIVACAGDCTEPTPEPVELVTIDADGEAVSVANGSSQVISGTAARPTGTEIVVTVQSTGDTQPRFYRTGTAVVTENGTWAIAFDFGKSSAGAMFRVEASVEDGTESATVGGEVIRCEGDCTDTPPTDTPTPIPEQTPTTATERAGSGDSTVSLAESVVDTVRGDTAVVELRFEDADGAELTLGDENESGYELETVVRDADGDGSATLYVDTELAGRDGEAVSVSSGDEVSVESETDLGNALAGGEYELRVGTTDPNRDDVLAVGTLYVSERGATPTGSPTPTPTPAGDDDMTGILVSGGILLGGGAVALLLVRR